MIRERLISLTSHSRPCIFGIRSNEWTTLLQNIGKLLCLLLNFQKSLLDPYMCLEVRDLKVLGFDTLSKKEERSTTKNNHAKI